MPDEVSSEIAIYIIGYFEGSLQRDIFEPYDPKVRSPLLWNN